MIELKYCIIIITISIYCDILELVDSQLESEINEIEPTVLKKSKNLTKINGKEQYQKILD